MQKVQTVCRAAYLHSDIVQLRENISRADAEPDSALNHPNREIPSIQLKNNDVQWNFMENELFNTSNYVLTQ